MKGKFSFSPVFHDKMTAHVLAGDGLSLLDVLVNELSQPMALALPHNEG
jgi:hypothetical protein